MFYSVESLLGSLGEENKVFAEFALQFHKEKLVQFLKMDMDTEETSPEAPIPAQEKRLSVRQKMQEMRQMGSSITPLSRLSNNETVGEFLLAQWLSKENNKKKK